MRFELNDYCTKCDLCVSNNKKITWGEGFLSADIMFVGDFPKAYEKRMNTLFEGKRYTLFKSLLNKINIGKHNAYFTTLVKCKTIKNRRPTTIETPYFTTLVKCKTIKNRRPTTIETRKCYDYFVLEYEKVNPKIVVLLGSYVTTTIFPTIDFKPNKGGTFFVGTTLFVILHDINYMVRHKDNYAEYLEDYIRLGLFFKAINTYHYFNF